MCDAININQYSLPTLIVHSICFNLTLFLHHEKSSELPEESPVDTLISDEQDVRMESQYQAEGSLVTIVFM